MQTNQARTTAPTDAQSLGLRVGEVVEVRSEREILATLDEQGRLEALPFMPEMLRFAGQRLRVSKRAIKACDTIGNSGMYRMEHAVHLEGARCDGQAHGGCQASCLLFWKEAWLKRVDPDPTGRPPAGARAGADERPAQAAAPEPSEPRCTVTTLWQETRAPVAESSEERFSCQATELPKAAPLHVSGWNVRQYVEDVTSGNARTLPMIRSLLVVLFNKYQLWSQRLPRRLRIHDGKTYPFLEGRLEGMTPKQLLNLQPGELVEVKSKEEIFQTLDKENRNRGLQFNVEMLKYCGRRARVLRRVDKIIDERSGRMLHFSNDCIVLQDVICDSDYHQYCPRGIYPYWREIWLRRVT
jgi:hypothetical protein